MRTGWILHTLGFEQLISITGLVESSPTCRYSNFQLVFHRWFCCYGRIFEEFKWWGDTSVFNNFLVRRAIGGGRFEKGLDNFFLRVGQLNNRMENFCSGRLSMLKQRSSNLRTSRLGH
jgi:hypothetical protein